ncbi:hypothetical protein [Flavobacterium sp.]|uniref:hypothetical protein n=1 Tax=Flavobacterium sp. TaxID=239 RepID=UPI0025BC4C38|nr:hypothetical protein [Flavobacterium sp.]
MDVTILKKIVDKFPIVGDEVILIDKGYALYKSGGKVKIPSDTRLQIGDKVVGVYHGYEEKKGEPRIILNIEHLGQDSLYDDQYYQEYVKINREHTLAEILSYDE